MLSRALVGAAAFAVAVAVQTVHAQDVVVVDPVEPVVVEPTPLTGPQSVPQNRIAGDFRPMLGNDAEAVVSGLRTGGAIELTETTPGPLPGDPPETTTVVIESPTGPLGNGEVRHTLDLARFELARAGIEQPTASELQAVLNGGSVTNADGVTTELPGVLAMRSEGMGWGQIAHEMGTTMGAIKNGAAVATPPAAPTPADGSGVTDATGASSAGTATVREHGRGSHIVTGTGEAAVSTATQGHGRGHGITDATGATQSGRGHGRTESSVTNAVGDTGGGHGRGAGITDALGASGGGSNAGGRHIVNAAGGSNGGGHGRGAGIVDGLGASSGGGGHGGGAAAVSNALGGSDHGGGFGGGGGGGGGHGHGHGRGGR